MLKEFITVLSRAYAAIIFIDNTYIGLLLIGITLIFPNIGLAGLFAAVIGFLTAKIFEFPQYDKGIHTFNSLLVGLSLGAFYTINSFLVLLIAISSPLTVFITVALIDRFSRTDGLPVLSLPFILVSSIAALAAQHFSSLSAFIIDRSPELSWLNPIIGDFFSALGAIYFTTHPFAGFIIFFSVLSQSRYLALLTICGYILGVIIFNLLADSPHPNLLQWTAFNFVLTAIAVGGIFTIPGLIAFSVAMLAVCLTVLIVIATQNLLFMYGLPVLALPFVTTTLVFLAALRTRTTLSQPWLAPEPALPEINFERARLARVRNGDINSVPLLTPFYGQWNIYQGFDGPHTHKAPWQHALDFYITENDKSFTNDGNQLEDFHCFGLPLLSPAHGQVIRVYDQLADNPPGEVDSTNNWGNFILIRLDSGLHVLLAHLRCKSIKVNEGERITPGTVVAMCGNSGRSPQPHLHLQVQRSAELGSATHPFHLCSVINIKPDQSSEYLLVSRPVVGDRIEATAVDIVLAEQLHLPVGRQLSFQMQNNYYNKSIISKLQVDLTILGQFRLVSDSGASAAFEETNGVIACYDRQGPKDAVLDMWLLASGLTPLTESADHWQDSPPAQLLPLNLMQKMFLWIFRPLGCGLSSQYSRHWNATLNCWIQTGKHQLKIGTKEWFASTQAKIEPQHGCQEIMLDFNKMNWRAKLIETGLSSDSGIPGWTIHNNP